MTFRIAVAGALPLDLARLKKVAARLGVERTRSVGTRSALHRINRALGESMASGDADKRSALAQAMVEADASLPARIRNHAGPGGIAIDLLRQDGCLDLGQRLDREQAAEVKKYLESKPLRLGPVPQHWNTQVASLDDVPRGANFACYDRLDLWSSPHLLELVSGDDLLDLAQSYLGCTPTLCSFNAYWALSERPADPKLQAFHRELDDGRSLAIFVLLTPVEDLEDGAHFYVETSHDLACLEAGLRADGVGTKLDYLLVGPFVAPMAMRLFGRNARRFKGPAGAAFCIDGFGLNRSVVPRSRPKLLLEFRFGTFFNEYVYDVKLGAGTAAARAVRGWLPRFLRGGASFSQDRREQRSEILRRIPSTPRHKYFFRYMIDELSLEV
jgi:hypothetical protein